MKNPLKIAINFLASLFVMVSGAMQAVRAEEVWLYFSVSEADIVVKSSSVTNTPEAAPNALNSQRRYYPWSVPKEYEKAPENTAKRIALDFGVPNINGEITPITTGTSAQTELTPPPLKTELTPSPKPIIKPPTRSTAKTLTAKPLTRSKQLTALRRAIIGQESAGRFWLVNPDSGALGYGQLLRENVAPWTKAALGKALTPEEFLANPKLQIKTIDYKLNQYLKRELAYTSGKNDELAIRRVASRWYSGNPNLWNNTRPQYSNGRRYPSIASYTRSVWKRYLREIDNG
jgi:hypothetical protein